MKREYECCRCGHIERIALPLDYSLNCDLPSDEADNVLHTAAAPRRRKCSLCGGTCHPTKATARKLARFTRGAFGRVLAILALLLLPLSAQAGTIPLARFEWSQPEPVSLPAEYRAVLTMYTPGHESELWKETVTEFPYHSEASQEIVSEFNRLLYLDDNGELQFINGGQNIGICGWCQLFWSIGEGADRFLAEKAAAGWDAEMFVPRVGSHLDGYLITGIERTVTADSQTITFSGIPIPEPACLVLVLCGLVIQWRMR